MHVGSTRKFLFQTAPSIMEFKFNKKRVRVLSDASEVPERVRGIVYWMSRDQRVQGTTSLCLQRWCQHYNNEYCPHFR